MSFLTWGAKTLVVMNSFWDMFVKVSVIQRKCNEGHFMGCDGDTSVDILL